MTVLRAIDRRRFLLSAAAVAAPAVLSRPGHAATVGANEIVIGTHLPLSGPGAVVATSVRNGLQMRVDEANEAGGLNGRKLRLVVEDNAGQASLAVRAVDKLLLRDGIFAMLCPWGSGPNTATIKRVGEAGVVSFSPFAASTLLHEASGQSPLLFTTNPNYDTTTAAGMTWLAARLDRKLMQRGVGYIYDDSFFGESAGKGLKSSLSTNGGALAVSAAYKPGDIDLSGQVARMRAANVGLIFCAAGTRELIAIGAEVRKLGWSDVAIASATVGRNGVVASLGKAAVEGIYGFGAWRIPVPGRYEPGEQAWTDSYRKRFGAEADDVALWFHGQADWLVNEMKRAGRELTTAALVESLKTSRHRGLASYDTQRFERGHAAPEWIRVEQIVQGRWTAASELIAAT